MLNLKKYFEDPKSKKIRISCKIVRFDENDIPKVFVVFDPKKVLKKAKIFFS